MKFIWALGLCFSLAHAPATHAASTYIDSAIAAIESANGQARLDLTKGIYKSSSGSTDFILEIPASMGSTLRFDYRYRAIISASWNFSQSVFVQIKSGNKCVRLRVDRLTYGEGGFLTGDSEQKIVPSGPCRESEPLSRINDFLRLTADPADFFRGASFVALTKMRRCTNETCSASTSGLPVRRVAFFGSIGPDGKPLSALRASFAEGARIILPSDGFLSLAPNSEAIFNDLTYDLESKTGSTLLRKFNVTLNDGIISGGHSIFRIRPESHFTAEEVKIEKDDIAFHIDRGTLSGRLGAGSSIILTSSAGKESRLNLNYAEATFTGIAYDGAENQSSLSIQRGVLAAQLENAELWFSARNHIRLGYTNLNVVLGCGTDTDACRPVQWTPDKVSVQGTINTFSATMDGGQFNLSDNGVMQIKSGSIAADTLIINTDNLSPITGRVNKFEIAVEAQDLIIDQSTSARVAQASIVAEELEFRKDDALPIGTVRLAGRISGLEGGRVGRVRFEAGAQVELLIERRERDEPEIKNGTVGGEVKVAMDGGNFLTVKIDLGALRYYRGHGDAILKLTALNGTYVFETPAEKETKSKFGFKAEIDVKSVRLAPMLAAPVVIGPTALKASGSVWQIAPVQGVPFSLKVPIGQQELVYAPIKPPTGGTLCAPKVILEGQTPAITGRIDAFASNSGGKIRIYDVSISQGIVATVDGRNCDGIAGLVCFLVGSAFGGPIGGAGLACLCLNNLDDAKQKLTDRIRDESIRHVSNSKFDFSF